MEVVFYVFGYLSGKLWEIWDKARIGKIMLPPNVAYNLKGKIISDEQGSELKKEFYVALLGGKICCLEDISKITSPELASTLSMMSRFTYNNIRKSAKEQEVILGGIKITYEVEKTGNKHLIPLTKRKIEPVLVHPDQKSYSLTIKDYSYRIMRPFDNVLLKN